MIGFMGLAGQGGYNMISAAQTSEANPRRSIMQRLTESKWMPLKALSDQQYEEMLQQKIFKIDVEISIIDETITNLKATEDETPHGGPRPRDATSTA